MRRYDYGSISTGDLNALLRRGDRPLDEWMEIAKPIVEAVRRERDRALYRYARKFDGFRGRSLAVTAERTAEALSRLKPGMTSALRLSEKRIRAYHSRQSLKSFEFRDSCGVFGQRVLPLDRVGIYVPGGTAAYASSVLMSAVPARLAGVRELVMCTPAKGGEINDAVLAAASIAGVDEVYSVGGAHGIAAMAYGTETIRSVSKIVGPGGSIVSAAKTLVRSEVEIDFVAGPSEVLIIADGAASYELVASEMAAQLEHDPAAVAVLVSPSNRLLDKSLASLRGFIESADRRSILERSSAEGAIFLKVASLAQAVDFSNAYAPEHLLIDTKNPRAVLKSIERAGSVFLGRKSSVVFGDYCSGPNHVLPTLGAARSSSALSVYDFLRTLPYQELSQRGATALAPAVAQLAEAEGLPGHVVAARLRAGGTR